MELPEIKLTLRQKLKFQGVILTIADPYKTKSLLHTKGLWRSSVVQFQYDMSLDVTDQKIKNVRQEFLNIAYKEYNDSDQAKEEYLKWLLKIQ